jgi:hypothetical protein
MLGSIDMLLELQPPNPHRGERGAPSADSEILMIDEKKIEIKSIYLIF